MKKLIRLSVLVLSIFTISNIPAYAGVVKQLIEVDPQQRQVELEEEQQKIEEYQQEATMAQEEAVEKAKEIIEEQIEEAQPAPIPEPVVQEIVEEKSLREKLDHCWICRPMGALTGMLAGSMIALTRGGVSKARQYGEALDSNKAAIVTAPVGVVGGAATGMGSGIFNGLFTGLVKGWTHPFSRESYSAQEADYDPYVFLGGE